MNKVSFGLLIGMGIGACGSDGGGAASATAAAKPAPSSSAVSAGSAKPAGSGSASAAATPTSSDFGLVTEGDHITIYPAFAGAFVDTGAFVAELGDGPLVQDPAVTKTAYTGESGGPIVTNAMHFDEFWGSYPDQVLAKGTVKTSGGWNALMGRVNATWTSQDPMRDGEELLDVTPWDNKRAIAAIRMSTPDIRFQLVNSSGGVVVPAPANGPSDVTDCVTRMDPKGPLALAGLPSGHLFAIGVECKTGKPIAERWEPKKDHGTPGPIDGVPDGATPVAIAAVSDKEAYAVFTKDAATLLSTWDGTAWKTADAPFGKPTAGKRSVFAAPDGGTWGVGEGGLFTHPKGGAWTKVEVPGKPTSAWAKDDKTVWVVVDGKKLYRKGAHDEPIKLPPSSDVDTAFTRDKRWLATKACKSIYVYLAAIGPSGGDAPKNFPGLTAAVKGNDALAKLPYIVEDVGPTYAAGAVVPSMEIGDQLIKAFVAKNDKAKPMVFCNEPVAKGKLSVE